MSDGILPIPAIPAALREASQRGVLIPFIGAGASVLAGCPTWGDFADGALKACIDAKKFTHGQLDQIRHLSGHVAELVGIEGGVVSGVINLESSGV